MAIAIAFALGACSTSSSATKAAPSSSGSTVPARGAEPGAGGSGEHRNGEHGGDAPPEPTFGEVVSVLFENDAERSHAANDCLREPDEEARVRCALERRYADDREAAALARELYTNWRVVAGVERAHVMDGGYRGKIHIEPARPVRADRKHLEWIVRAFRDFDAFFRELEERRIAERAIGEPSSDRKYRFRTIALRFMRSVAARTPAAYAHDWTVAYNFAGSINLSADAVRETMFHEIFHLNDFAHGGWSPGALGPIFDGVSAKCKTSIPCLAPYSPNDTIVRGGTYYSFQPGNGVREYAAELAIRYYREQRAALRGLPKPKAFKCGAPENARAWSLLRDEFFGGVDVVPACA